VAVVEGRLESTGTPDVLASLGASGHRRLGLDGPRGWWPTAPRLKSYEAAGFGYVQLWMPDRALLAQPEAVGVHGTALWETLRLTSLHLILHAPEDLFAGTPEHDRQLDGALSYAALTGAEMIVYHGAQARVRAAGVRERLADERRSLRRALRRASGLGIRIAIQNLAPSYAGLEERVADNPLAVDELVRWLDSEAAGTCLDIGHAHVVAGLVGCELAELVEPALERAVLFGVHDNFGAAPSTPRSGGIEPLRLDLHMPPGAGTVPWAALAPMLAWHGAPLQLEIHPNLRPEPATLAILARELLGLRAPLPAA
jgi:sugar phosphate isomerase/epimerase